LGTASPLAAGAAVALAAGATLTLGVAHGALDHELAERLRHASRSATARIAAAYAAAVGAGFAAFLAAPLPLLAVFLVVSVFHFGTADVAFADWYAGFRGGRHARLRTVALGAFPIVVPLLAHPQGAFALLPHAVAVNALPAIHWSTVRFALLGAAAIAVTGATLERLRHAASPGWYRWELALAFAAFVFAPPVVAFFVYFGAWHATRHLLRLAEAYGVDPNGEFQGRSALELAAFALRALPMTTAAVGAACVLAALLAREVPISVVATALGFAVTIPHTLAVRFFNRAATDRRWPLAQA
jgi:Brp/Blh family beta-carotene 15,15'-monooxygenase